MKAALASFGSLLVLGGVVCGCATTAASDIEDEDVGEASSAICEGWDRGGRTCSAKCSDGGWYEAGHAPSVAYGQCQEAAVGKCTSMGLGYDGACWSF